MKNLTELFELMAIAIEQSKGRSTDWFFNYVGHVNQIDVTYYRFGWNRNEKDIDSVRLSFGIDEDGIQAAYWFIKANLK